MHNSVQNLNIIEDSIKLKLKNLRIEKIPKIIAVSKTFKLEKILPLLEYGHKDFGENKIQEAMDKWSDIKPKYTNIKLHFIGKLQTNKVKFAIRIFDYLHSVDTEKLAQKISTEQLKHKKKIKIFIQVNIGNEEQKSGINKNKLEDFYVYCKKLDLDVVGVMCIPPENENSKKYFNEMSVLNNKLGLNELSMGMSADYLDAVENYSTYLRIGSRIFGPRD
jgi:PLP dependent protein